MKNTRKITLLALSTILAFSIGGCSQSNSSSNKEEQKKFDAFIQNEFVETMEDNYLNTHIYMENPADFGVEANKVTVEIDKLESDENYNNNVKETKKAETKFNEFDRDTLTDDQKDTYDIYKFNLDLALRSNEKKFQYIGNYFQTLTGIHTQIPTLFADLTLRNEEDVKNLVTLVNHTKTYMDSLLAYTTTQAKEGYLMVDIDAVIEYCEKIKAQGENSSTLTSMKANIDALQLTNGETYKTQVSEAFTTSFLPAYQAIIDTMTKLKTEKNNTAGVSAMENGKEYYEILFENATSSSRSIKDTKELLKESASNSFSTIQEIATTNPDVYEKLASGTYKTSFNDFDSMLVELNKNIKKDFPAIKELSYEIKPLDKDLANNGIAAYFNLPAIDGTTPKQIRVNTNEDSLEMQGITTFATVAHEGLPGHMYQVSYSYENMTSPYRKILTNCGGYTEGYATYVELFSGKYLTEIDADAIELENAFTIFQNSLVALLDIGIHYEDWTVKDAEQLFADNGMDTAQMDIAGLYKQIQGNPTAFLSYYVGYAEIESLRNEAQDKLGKKFEDKAFHEAILKSGSAPFSVVQRNVEAYIESAK